MRCASGSPTSSARPPRTSATRRRTARTRSSGSATRRRRARRRLEDQLEREPAGRGRRECGGDAYLIDDETDLDPAWLEGHEPSGSRRAPRRRRPRRARRRPPRRARLHEREDVEIAARGRLLPPACRPALTSDDEGERRLPRTRRRAQRRRLRPPLPDRGGPGLPAELHRGRRGDERAGGRVRRAPDRELALGPGERDARPALRLGALDHRRDRSCRSAIASSASASVALEEIKVIRSHPAALDQCRRLLAAMPWATAIAAATTADAAHDVAEDGDPTEAAIASERAAAMYGLTVIAGDVGDHPEAYTRFVSVAPYTRLDRETRGLADGVLLRHRPSAGSAPPGDRALRATPARHGPACLAADPPDALALSLRRRARRPPARPGRQRDALRGAGLTRELRVFGSYPSHG